MLDYIRQQIAERQKAAQPQTMTEADENDLIVEYAHLFQELDDLSVEGQDAYRDRSLELDIPIENDIELDTIEMNLMDGRITDIPMDAIVNQENFVESMKTYADFYLEACSVVQPFMREDAYNLEERRQAWAKKHYDVYHEQMVQEGLYGFDRMSMDDDHVPTNVMCDFGLLGSDDVQRYMVKSPVFFESADGEIVASQLTALTVAKNEHIFEQFADVLANKLNVNRNDVWDVATPTRVIVPVPKDEYHIIVEFDCENKNVPQYCGWKMSRKPSVRNNPIPENMYPSEASSQIVAAIPLMNKKEYVKESYVAPVVKMPSRWDQYEDVYMESTKGFVAGVTVLELLVASAVNVGIGYTGFSAVSQLPETLANIIACVTIGWGMGSLMVSTTNATHIIGEYVVKKNIDKVMVKSITKDIAKVLKTLSDPNKTESSAINNLKKFKKTSKKLADEIRYNLPEQEHSWHTGLEDRQLPAELEKELRVLAKLAEQASIYVEFDNEKENKKFLKQYFDAMDSVVKMMFEKQTKSTWKTDEEITKESYSYSPDSMYSIIQEAIDFGYPDANTEAANKNQPADSPQGQQQQQSNDNNPPELNEGGNDPSSPTIDAGGNDTPPEDNTPGEPATDTPPADEPKSPVETNDVSDQIAENISNQTTDNGADANGDISIDDDLGSDVGDDMNMDTPDASTPDSIDSDLDSLDSMGGSNTDEAPMGDPSTMDIDSMSIDDIMAQAAEKLKGMPIEQVKKFLTDGAGGLDDASSTGLDDTGMQTESYYAQEAFLGIITKKNVKPELDEAIRGCLGVLNDSNKSLSEIIVGFKKAGKKLNKVLGKAIKMTDVFGTDQLTHLNKLNSALVKLQTGLKPTVSTDETNAVKAMIKNFTSEAVIVGKFLESNTKNPTMDETDETKDGE
jgi:hypothetical protein